MRILIVDDSELPLRELETLLGEMGHQVVGTARNGQDGITKFRRLQPDVVVMDVIMPRMTGLEALQSIRNYDPEARVVMVCSLNSCSAAFEAERQGAAYFITKPFEKPRLRTIFDKLAKEVDAKTGPKPKSVSDPLNPARTPPLPILKTR
ncbi:MAG: response regulator [Deltaproteobacteria bacterium]|nr:response regulator [Deltaproteobacteria bacterium]